MSNSINEELGLRVRGNTVQKFYVKEIKEDICKIIDFMGVGNESTYHFIKHIYERPKYISDALLYKLYRDIIYEKLNKGE